VARRRGRSRPAPCAGALSTAAAKRYGPSCERLEAAVPFLAATRCAHVSFTEEVERLRIRRFEPDAAQGRAANDARST